jgi:hypothetical protein
MMKKLLSCLVFIMVFGVSQSWADPEDCMSKEEAETLVKKLKKERYIVDYCDCCDDASENGDVTANLLFIKKLSIVSCEYDDARFSVKMETQMLSSFAVNEGKYMGKATYEVNSMEYALLNYQFYFTNQRAPQLGYLVRNDEYEAPNCSGLDTFPNPEMVGDKKYQSWYKKKSK